MKIVYTSSMYCIDADVGYGMHLSRQPTFALSFGNFPLIFDVQITHPALLTSEYQFNEENEISYFRCL